MTVTDNTQLNEMQQLLVNMVKLSASDLHLKVGMPPIYRINGDPKRVKSDMLTDEHMKSLVHSIMAPRHIEQFETNGSADLAVMIDGAGRFRVNVFKQRGLHSLVARRISDKPPSIEDLGLPKVVHRIPPLEDGLVLVVGVTGSGKSSTLAAIIDRINQISATHIVTVEDPIEFTYTDGKSFINQREIGLDVPSFPIALRAALRQDPDVIMVGELRDVETVETALAAAETGHLVLSTLHSNNAVQTISRILEFYPKERQPNIRNLLAATLRVVLAQRLVPTKDPEHPRTPAVEVMFVNPVIRKLISEDEDSQIHEAIRNAAQDGMQDFNMSLYRLVKSGLVDSQDAIDRSPNPDQLRMQLKGMVLNQDRNAL